MVAPGGDFGHCGGGHAGRAILDDLVHQLAGRWPEVRASLAVLGPAGGCWHEGAAGGAPGQEPGQFLIYSLTKTVLATLALQLVHSGALGLDAPAARWLPGIPHLTGIAVRQLLRHSAGVRNYSDSPAYSEAVRERPLTPWTTEEFIARTLGAGPAFPPDGGWGYSNTGYLLLRLLVERAAGAPFRELVRDRIAAPLDLRATAVLTTPVDLSALVPGYSRLLARGDGAVDVRGLYHPGWVGHGVLASTAPETARFLHRLLTGALLPAGLMQEMTAAVPVPGDHPPFIRPAYGLGLMADLAAPHGATFGHTGGGPGYSAAAYHLRRDGSAGVTAVVLCNVEDSTAEAAALRCLDVLAPPPADTDERVTGGEKW
jgi:D-alanyl-D-alanine carboxypeptidase